MKKLINSISILFVFFIITISTSAQPIPSDSLYLGQILPGNIPKVFNLPVTTGLRPAERIAITSDGKEIYYSELNAWPATIQRIKYYKYLDNKWQGPFVAFEGYVAPGLADNDNTMYMQKNVNSLATTYFSTRNNSEWSTPTKLLSTNEQQHYNQKTKLNNFYLSSTSTSSSGSSDICTLVTITKIQSLGKPINTTDTENDFFIARDESYLIFIRFNNYSASDLYISYKNDKGNWTNPKKFETPINIPNPTWDCCPYVSDDNKYLFFTRGDNEMSSYYTYWVKIDDTIERLKNANFLPYLKNQIEAQSIQVGHSFSFTLLDETFIDDDGNNTLTYTATLSDGRPLPSWLSFNSATQTFTGTSSELGLLKIKVTATDTEQAFASCEFEISINK